jgi:hypothetical protein
MTGCELTEGGVELDFQLRTLMQPVPLRDDPAITARIEK